MSTSSKLSSHPFVPSPQWLSESPARPPSSGTSNSPWRKRQDPHQPERLLSPVPPPPANLYPGSPDAFNVDPGVPFLATAGPSDVVSTEDGSESESSRGKRFVGGLVTGIRDTVRRSLRRHRRNTFKEPAFAVEQQEFRDSGYAPSSVNATAPAPARQPSSTEAQTSHEQGLRRAAPAQYYTTPYYSTYYTDHDYRTDFDAVADLQGRLSLFSGTVTAETASIKYGSDYAKMETPLDTEGSLSAYIKRTKHLITQISALPFSNRARVTYDHFPERDLRDDPRRRPFVEWHRAGYDPTDYSPAEGSKPAVSSATVPSQQNSVVYMPHHVPAPELDLREEFADTHSFAKANPAPQLVPMTSGPKFQAMSTKPASQRQTFNTAPIDQSWDKAINDATRRPARKRRATFHRAASIDAEPTQAEWQQYPHYRDGYVPAELAEGHYGSRYGPGIHSARAGPISPRSGPLSVTSDRHPNS